MAEVVLVAVIAARVIVPLAIPRWPLPAIVAALIIDAVDQTVFAAFNVEPANYQGYDKALDVYYLSIAYISTLRNWTSEGPFRIGQFLWYYRLIGVMIFELSATRILLLVFANTFEYYFIAYELVRVRYDPVRITTRRAAWVAAVIWICIKLPQEWWIHIAQLDFTDFLAEHAWAPWLLAALLLAGGGLLFAFRRRLPKPDWPAAFDVDTHRTTVVGEPADPPAGRRALIRHPVVEKTVLISLVTIIFAQILPGVRSSTLQIAVAVAVVVAANSFVGQRLVARGTDWSKATVHFASMAAINAGIVVAYALLVSRGARAPLTNTAVFLGLLTLIGTLYDRYRAMRLQSLRHQPARSKGLEPLTF